jgi:hypothetical protein
MKWGKGGEKVESHYGIKRIVDFETPFFFSWFGPIEIDFKLADIFEKEHELTVSGTSPHILDNADAESVVLDAMPELLQCCWCWVRYCWCRCLITGIWDTAHTALIQTKNFNGLLSLKRILLKNMLTYVYVLEQLKVKYYFYLIVNFKSNQYHLRILYHWFIFCF